MHQQPLTGDARADAIETLHEQCDRAMRATAHDGFVTPDNRDWIEGVMIALGAVYRIRYETAKRHVRTMVSWMCPDKSRGKGGQNREGSGGERFWPFSPAQVIKAAKECPSVFGFFPTSGLFEEFVRTGKCEGPPKSITPPKAKIPEAYDFLAQKREQEDRGHPDRVTPAEIARARLAELMALGPIAKDLEESCRDERPSESVTSESSGPSRADDTTTTDGPSTTTRTASTGRPNTSEASCGPSTDATPTWEDPPDPSDDDRPWWIE